MALSASRLVNPTVFGDQKVSVVEYTFDNDYPTGGEAVSVVSDLGLNDVHFALVEISSIGGTVDVAHVEYDRANDKLLVFDQTPAQVANNADLSTLKVLLVAFGK